MKIYKNMNKYWNMKNYENNLKLQPKLQRFALKFPLLSKNQHCLFSNKISKNQVCSQINIRVI